MGMGLHRTVIMGCKEEEEQLLRRCGVCGVVMQLRAEGLSIILLLVSCRNGVCLCVKLLLALRCELSVCCYLSAFAAEGEEGEEGQEGEARAVANGRRQRREEREEGGGCLGGQLGDGLKGRAVRDQAILSGHHMSDVQGVAKDDAARPSCCCAWNRRLSQLARVHVHTVGRQGQLPRAGTGQLCCG